MGRGLSWSDEDQARLRELVAQGKTDIQIAGLMHRTEQAITSMRWRERITRRRYLELTPKLMGEITWCRNHGKTWKQIGAILGFHPYYLSSVYAKALEAQKAAIAHSD